MNHVISHATVPGALVGGGARQSSPARETAPVALPTTVIPTTWPGRTALLVVVMTLMHGIIAAGTNLSDTEAYYAQWARTPSLSYYDHPPLIAWMTWLTSSLSSASWALRLGPVFCGVIFDLLAARLATRLFSARAAFFAVAIVSAMPVFFFTSFLVNPEALLTPLWALFLVVLLDLRDHDEWWRPLIVGAVIGVAFLAKYTAILAIPVALLYVAGSASLRRWLRRPSSLVAGLVALALVTPVLVWNARHGWPSLQLHLSERMTRPADQGIAGGIARVLRGQLVFFSPILFPALVGVLGLTLVRARRDERYRLLAVASAPVLAFLFFMMVRAGDSEAHWTMVGYLPLVVAAGGILDEAGGRAAQVARPVFGAGIALTGLVAVLYAIHMMTPALAKRLPSYDPVADPLSETIGWDRVTAAIDAHAAKLGRGTVVAGAHNVLCGHVEAALDDTPPVYCASPRRTEYDFIGRRSPPESAPVVFVDSDRYPADAVAALPHHACGPVQRVEVDRAGLRQGVFRIRDCKPVGETAR
jgi:hypothetical protein